MGNYFGQIRFVKERKKIKNSRGSFKLKAIYFSAPKAFFRPTKRFPDSLSEKKNITKFSFFSLRFFNIGAFYPHFVFFSFS